MKISIVKETRENERRVLLLPDQVRELSSICDVQVEASAGGGVGVSDDEYLRAGAKVVTRDEAWTASELVLKLKCPSANELLQLPLKKSIAALFHAENAPSIVDLLLERGITAYSFEYFEDRPGHYPLMRATGELAGQQSILYAAYHLQSHLGGLGRQLAACTTSHGARVAILGFGNVGQAAAKLALTLGAEVIVFRWRNDVAAEAEFRHISFLPWDSSIAAKVIPTCDVVIGAIRISTFDTKPFITREIVRQMSPGSIIIDVTAGYGAGYIETSDELTTLSAPTRQVGGVTHIKIREFPLGFHVTAARQISTIYGPLIKGWLSCLQRGIPSSLINSGKITENGKITNDHVLKHYKPQFAK
jgi:alanine dehydrogenase